MRAVTAALASLALVGRTLASDIISTNGFTNCDSNGDSSVTVQNLDISFDRSSNKLNFDVAGTSAKSQNVTATLVVTAYGVNVYNDTFNPCDSSTFVQQLCPVPKGSFSAQGAQTIPSQYASKIPGVAYTIPDLDGSAQMILDGADGQQVACIQSTVTNGKSVDVPAVSYVAAAIAAAALGLSLVSAGMAGGHPGASHSSPGFTEVMWWFQGIATDGMFSVNYPGIYRSFTKNFAFSTGLVSWSGLQISIDNFRKSTGGNLTDASYEFFKNTTLSFPGGATADTSSSFTKRAFAILERQITTSVNGTDSGTSASHTSGQSTFVSGIGAYVEQLTIPQANTFMTVLLIFAIIVGVIVVGILLLKVILEAWSLIGKFPKSLTTFRKEYWRVMAQTIVQLMFLLYSVWTMYCIFQFTHGDSWAAKLLAGITLALFTAVLAFYVWKIWSVVRRLKAAEGSSDALYENKETWKKYKLFYENFKKNYWWLFIPQIVYMFCKGCILAAGNGHGMAQTIAQMVLEALMLILLLWNRPYTRKSGNWINIVIQIVRVLSVVCILIFVEELGISKTTQTITGVVLIVVQAALTGILAILIAINSLISCCKENPHRKRRKAAEKMALSRDMEGDVFLMEHTAGKDGPKQMSEPLGYDDMRSMAQEHRQSRYGVSRGDSHDNLVANASPMGSQSKRGYHSLSQPHNDIEIPAPGYSQYDRQPRLPDLGFEPFRDRR